MKISTEITKLFGIDLPIIQAGMSWASSSPELPAAVSNAGGLGVLAAGPLYLDDLAQAIDRLRDMTDKPFAVNMPLYRKQSDEALDILADKNIDILIASQGGTSKYLARFKALGTKCIHVVASEAHAKKAADAGVDGLLVVGGEAGGHPPKSLVSTLVLLRAIAKMDLRVPLIASGGLADGYGLAAALALGASAGNFGTRFLATPEASVSAAYKDAVLAAGVESTRLVGRDQGMIRAISNTFTDKMLDLEALNDVAQASDLFKSASLKMAALDGDVTHGKVEAGQSAGLVNELVPAAELVHQIACEYERALDQMPVVTR